MAKKKLIWYPGAMYHVTSRGNRRSDLFKDEEDYLIYLDVVKEAIEYYNNSYEVTEESYLPKSAVDILKSKVKLSDEKLEYLDSHCIDIK